MLYSAAPSVCSRKFHGQCVSRAWNQSNDLLSACFNNLTQQYLRLKTPNLKQSVEFQGDRQKQQNHCERQNKNKLRWVPKTRVMMSIVSCETRRRIRHANKYAPRNNTLELSLAEHPFLSHHKCRPLSARFKPFSFVCLIFDSVHFVETELLDLISAQAGTTEVRVSRLTRRHNAWHARI